MAKVVEGLPTKSAKIRALATEGYSRAAIARFLGIAYQHVRKVLEDVGSREGLQRGNSPRPAPSPVAEILRVEVLVAAGFTRLGCWKAADGGIVLETAAPKHPGVYAFAVNGVVQYVGVTSGTFHQRMYQYKRGDAGQKTNARINPIIAAELASERSVEIYLATPEPSNWNDLPVSTAAGLEEGLIARYSLPWNIRGARS
jgi:hypothetical protein